MQLFIALIFVSNKFEKTERGWIIAVFSKCFFYGKPLT